LNAAPWPEEPISAVSEDPLADFKKTHFQNIKETCRKTRAEGPRSEDGEIIVQMTAQKFGELLDLANSIILDSPLMPETEVDLNPMGSRALILARRVTEVFGGKSVLP
jgi:hypothetical protein